jgi:Flp pilus assembly protein TadD
MRFRLVHPGFAPSVSALVMLIGLSVPAIAALPPAGAISLNPAVAHLVSDARQAISAGDLRLAIVYLKNASSADPRNGRVRAELGKALMEAGDYASAEGELRLARSYGAPE